MKSSSALLRIALIAAITFACIPIALAIVQARNTPILQLFQGDGENFVLREPLWYEIKRTGKVIVVPPGFVTDFASVPALAQAMISVLGRHSVPAIVHDYLYWEQRCTRLQADLIMYDAMEEYNSSWFDKHAVYRALRIGAGGAWEQNAADRKKGLIRVLPDGYSHIQANTDWNVYRKALFERNVREESIGNGETSPPDYCVLPDQ